MRGCEGLGASPVSPERHLGLGEQLLGGAKRDGAARRVAGAGVGPYYIAFVAGSGVYRAEGAIRGCEGLGASPVSPERHLGLGEQLLGEQHHAPSPHAAF